MSRLSTLSPAALRAMFAPESDDNLIVLLTITGEGVDTPIRLADGYTQRLSETADDILYGVRSRGLDFVFLPLSVTLPTEEQAAVPRCQVAIHDVTRIIMPAVRAISTAPKVTMELVLSSTPDAVEAEFANFLMSSISYTADSITAELTVESLAVEPFPAHTFTPNYFPGLF